MKRQLRYFSIIIICSLIAAWFPLNGAAQEIGKPNSDFSINSYFETDSCCLNDFHDDPLLPKLVIKIIDRPSIGHFCTVIIERKPWALKGYHECAYMVQCATDRSFEEIYACSKRWPIQGDTNYNRVDTVAQFWNLPEGKTIYYRAYALAARDFGGVAVKGLASNIDTSYQIAAVPHCYPNPFNPKSGSVTLVFPPGLASGTKIKIYDLYGNLVQELTGSNYNGKVTCVWDGRNGRGDWVAPGGYIAMPEKDNGVKVKIAVKY